MVALKPFMEIVEAGLILVTLDDERVFSGKISFEDLIISIAKMSRANEELVPQKRSSGKAWQAIHDDRAGSSISVTDLGTADGDLSHRAAIEVQDKLSSEFDLITE
jgi:hypothetical protein